MNYQRVNQIILSLNKYGSAQARIESLLDSLRTELDLHVASILLVNPQSFHDLRIISSGGSDDLIQEYREKYYLEHFFSDPIINDVYTFSTANATSEGLGSEYLAFCLEKCKLHQVLGYDITITPNLTMRLRFGRNESGAQFSAQEIELVRLIAPHLSNMVENEKYGDCHQVAHLIVRKIIQGMDVNFVVINANLDVIYPIDITPSIFEEYSSVKLHRGKFFIKNRTCQAKLEELVGSMKVDRDRKLISYMTLDHENERPILAISQMANDYSYIFGNNCLFTIAIYQPRPTERRRDGIPSLWGLSAAESKLVSQLMIDEEIKPAAHALSISENTAKVQLRSAYRKIGVENKTQLFEKLIGMRPLFTLLQ